MNEYIMGLKGLLTEEQLRPLIGQSFKVRITKPSWGKEILSTDKIVVTHIKIQTYKTIGGVEEEGQMVQIYSDCYLGSENKYNAWNTLESIQHYMNEATK
jgi:hypothetical protein